MIVSDDDILGTRAEPVSGAAMEAVRKAGWPQQERYDECRQELDEANSRLAAREKVGACAHAAVVTPPAREDGPEAQDEHLAGCSEVVVEDVVRWKAVDEAI